MRRRYSTGIACLIYLALHLSAPHATQAANSDFLLITEILEVYDDNILYDAENELSDFITEIILGAGISRQSQTQYLSVIGSVKQELFADESSLDNNSQYLDIEYTNDIDPYSEFTLVNSFEHSESPESFEDAFGRTLGRFEFFQNDLLMEYTREINIEWGFGLSYANEWYETERDDISDSMNHVFGGMLEYHTDAVNTYFLEYLFDFAQYEDANSNDEVYVNQFALGLERDINKLSRFIAKLGISLIDQSGDSEDIKPFAYLEYINQWGENTEISLRAVKENDPSRFRNDVFDVWRLSSRLRHRISQRLVSTFTVFFGYGEFLRTDVRDTLFGGRCELEYDIRDNILLILSLLTQHNDSNLSSRDYSKNRISLGIKVEF